MMSRLSFKILLPFVAILYCIALLEIEIGDVEQTWGDEYDSYVTAINTSNTGNSYDASAHPDLTFTPLHLLYSYELPLAQVFFSNIELHKIISSSPQRLFIKNCTWLI